MPARCNEPAEPVALGLRELGAQGAFQPTQALLQLSDIDTLELRGGVARGGVREILMDAPVVPWPADRPSGAQEVDEEQGHEPKEDGDGDIDHPVIGAGLGRRGDTRRG